MYHPKPKPKPKPKPQMIPKPNPNPTPALDEVPTNSPRSRIPVHTRRSAYIQPQNKWRKAPAAAEHRQYEAGRTMTSRIE